MTENVSGGELETLIDREIELITAQPTLLNSFPLRLPFGQLRDSIAFAASKGASQVYLDEPSEELNGGSLRQLLEEIDVALAEVGIHQDRVRELQEAWLEEGGEGGRPAYNELVRLTLPAYRLLRLRGFSVRSLGGYGFDLLDLAERELDIGTME